MDEKLITVTGNGAIHVVPDVTRLELSLVSIHDSYEEAYAQANSDTDKLAKVMENLKLPISLPKTKSLNIDKKTQNEYDDNGHFVDEIFVGFELSHKIKIDLGIDNVLLSKLIHSIGQQLKQAEISIGFTVKDPRPLQLMMLERAVKDAQEKATIMAKACGCKLGLVKSINYSTHEVHIYSRARNIHDADEAMCCEMNALDITPDDLAVSDSVTVVWYLSNGSKKDKSDL